MERNESIISFSCCRLGYMKITCRGWERRKMIFNNWWRKLPGEFTFSSSIYFSHSFITFLRYFVLVALMWKVLANRQKFWLRKHIGLVLKDLYIWHKISFPTVISKKCHRCGLFLSPLKCTKIELCFNVLFFLKKNVTFFFRKNK